jgi:hypothetical protein
MADDGVVRIGPHHPTDRIVRRPEPAGCSQQVSGIEISRVVVDEQHSLPACEAGDQDPDATASRDVGLLDCGPLHATRCRGQPFETLRFPDGVDGKQAHRHSPRLRQRHRSRGVHPTATQREDGAAGALGERERHRQILGGTMGRNHDPVEGVWAGRRNGSHALYESSMRRVMNARPPSVHPRRTHETRRSHSTHMLNRLGRGRRFDQASRTLSVAMKSPRPSIIESHPRDGRLASLDYRGVLPAG